MSVKIKTYLKKRTKNPYILANLLILLQLNQLNSTNQLENIANLFLKLYKNIQNTNKLIYQFIYH